MKLMKSGKHRMITYCECETESCGGRVHAVVVKNTRGPADVWNTECWVNWLLAALKCCHSFHFHSVLSCNKIIRPWRQWKELYNYLALTTTFLCKPCSELLIQIPWKTKTHKNKVKKDKKHNKHVKEYPLLISATNFSTIYTSWLTNPLPPYCWVHINCILNPIVLMTCTIFNICH